MDAVIKQSVATGDRGVAFLREQFQIRKHRNPRFSQRRFAQTLGIDPSFLTKLLLGKRRVTPAMAYRLGSYFGLSLHETAGIFSLENPKGESGVPFRSLKLRKLTANEFSKVSSWVHFAIMECVELGDCHPNAWWFSQKLGIDFSLADRCLKELIAHGLLVVTPQGKLMAPADLSTTGIRMDLDGLRRMQVELAQKSAQSVAELPPEAREHSGVFVAIHPDQISMVKKQVARFRKNMRKLFSRSSSKQAVYYLGISFFPVTQNQGQEVHG